MKCGLLGRKLSHSYSPIIHAHLGSYDYELFEVEPENLEKFLKTGNFTGINVTIPYKKSVIPYLDALSPAAEKLGAVNTVVRRNDGSLYGHNTDYSGFLSMVRRCEIQVAGKKILVLGNGGAATTAVAVLQELGAHVIIISRSGENNFGNIHLHSDASVIVNATPVGMYPKGGNTVVDLSAFPQLEYVMDLIYNPARTKLMMDAEDLGIPADNGLWMLVAQAKEAAELFTGQIISDSVIPEIHRSLSLRMQNLILIGMPGCGKTTIGKLLAESTGRKYIDTDAAVEVLAQKTIPELFTQEGETAFRNMETEAIREIAAQSCQVIATGGGCVTREENYSLLHQNGIIIWLKRAPHLLPTDGRPLSQISSPEEIYAIRKPLYEKFTDFIIDNNGTPDQTVNAILALLEDIS